MRAPYSPRRRQDAMGLPALSAGASNPWTLADQSGDLTPRMNKAFYVYVSLAALALAVFAIWPQLDLAGARYFYHSGGFFGRNSFERFGRDFFRVTPFVVLVAYAALWLAKQLGASLRWAPSSRAMIFLIATMVIGPGLIVNLGLKDHWHRPRPDPDPGLQRAEPFHAVVR